MSIWQHSLHTWQLIFQDKGAILLLFVAGLIYSFFYPLPYHYEQVESVPAILIDQDQSTSSRTLQRLLLAAPNLELRQISNDPATIQSALWQGDVMALIIIPHGFHQDILAGRTAQVQVASHGGYLLAGSKALMNASEAAMTMGAAIRLHKLQSAGFSPTQAMDSLQPLQLHSRAVFNPKDGYGHSIVPAVMVLVIQQTLLIGVTLLLGRQAELKQLPSGWRAYSGMLLTFSSIGLLNSLYFFLVALRLQQYAQLGALLHLLVFCLLFSLCIGSFALLLGRLFQSRERGLQLLLVSAVPMLFISGYSWPAESLPTALYYLRWLLPSTAGIHGFVGINQLGANLSDILREVMALTGLSIALISYGLWLYRSSGKLKA
ncbi:ABC transporter permease [Alkalimonas amylolytica]|uniref:ABC-2 type transport system permease protein n=1 Tax=Alkalimonas amylolytica TaxID=152573 RepID=A0A1H4AUT2_ALKAM|nr:ABC transporter permease [Alkalimonas amylolytica]SEA39548.1 ABC-2 type transport system permease protein [Alkalimonas amylolytica]